MPGLEIREEIGTSLRGTVYLATNGRRSLAVKVFRRGIHLDRDALERLEKTAPGGIRHPNLAPIEALGELPDGCAYYATPYLRGDSLERLLLDLRRGVSERPSLSVFAVSAEGLPHPQLPRRSAEVFAEALDGLAAAHAAGLTHRRLSPRNLILTPSGRLVITDFGGQASTEGGDDLVYRAPEQLDPYPQGVGPAADVYAVGVILYELLTRRPPFAAASPRELKLCIEAGEFPAPRQLHAELSPALEACILKAMAFDPADRYSTAAELSADLRRFLQGEETEALRAITAASRAASRGHAGQRRDRGVWLRVAAAALILVGFVLWRWPGAGTTSVSLNPGLRPPEHGGGLEPAAAEAPPASARSPAVTVLAADPVARDLSAGDDLARAAALARLRAEIESGARARGDALLAGWVATHPAHELRLRAIEVMGAAGDSAPVLRVLGVGEGLPQARHDAETVLALGRLLTSTGDEPAREILCGWELADCERLDGSSSPAEHHLDPNLAVQLDGEPPRGFTRAWIRARSELDPAGLLEAAPRLSARADVVADVVAGLTTGASPAARAALTAIARERPFTGGYAALGALARVGAHAELLDLARSSLPAVLRARAVELIGAGSAELYIGELKTFALTSPDPEVRRAAFAVLESLDTTEAATVIPAAVYDLELKHRALSWARRTRMESALALHLDLLGHNDPNARAVAVEALNAAGAADILQPLVARLLDARKPTRDCAIDVLFARGELTRIPSAMARHFGRDSRPLDAAPQDALALLEEAWLSFEESARRFGGPAGAMIRRFWVETGLARMAGGAASPPPAPGPPPLR